MNREETHALLAQGRDAWNAWAQGMLAERKRLEEAGAWKLDEYGDDQTEATTAWLAAARADVSSKEAPHTFQGGVDLSGFVFPGDAGFDSALFSGDAEFINAQFNGDARFGNAQFGGYAEFGSAQFSRYARFDSVQFSGIAGFDSAQFSGDAVFDSAQFGENVGFNSAQFSGDARFHSAQFSGDAGFDCAKFSGYAGFDRAKFSGTAWFGGAKFSGTAGFHRAKFSGYAWFTSAQFSGTAWFHGAQFSGTAAFGQATFKGATSFPGAHFTGPASFEAILSERAFSLADAEFRAVPDFIQAHFAEAPRLDNSRFRLALVEASSKESGRFWTWPGRLILGLVKRLFRGDGNVPARWRALKRLASEGHDHEREQHFFAMEMRSARFATDWPLPLATVGLVPIAQADKETTAKRWLRRVHNGVIAIPFVFWRASAWAGFVRFWFRLVYQIVSDFGRSVLRPMLLWALTTAIAAAYFLGQSPDIADARARKPATGPLSELVRFADASLDAWLRDAPCFARNEGDDGKGNPQITGLVEPVRRTTSAANEAMYLAFRNGFIILDGGGGDAHRVYSCLYGTKRFADNPVPNVPSAVSYASIIQKLVSGLAIFLLGLGLRNMLRMR